MYLNGRANYDRTLFFCSGHTIVWIDLKVLALPASKFRGEIIGMSSLFENVVGNALHNLDFYSSIP